VRLRWLLFPVLPFSASLPLPAPPPSSRFLRAYEDYCPVLCRRKTPSRDSGEPVPTSGPRCNLWSRTRESPPRRSGNETGEKTLLGHVTSSTDRRRAACPRYESPYSSPYTGIFDANHADFYLPPISRRNNNVSRENRRPRLSPLRTRGERRGSLSSRAYVICRGGRYWIRRSFLANCLVFFSIKFAESPRSRAALPRIIEITRASYSRSRLGIDSNLQSYVITSPR